MASSGIRRKIDDLGRVVIPAGIRRTLGLREGDAIEVTVEGERVVLAKPRDACVFCGREEEELTGFRGRLLCRDCLTALGSVDERLRATAAAERPVAPGGRREVADLPSWDAPAASRPTPASGEATDRPAPAPAEATDRPAPAPAEATARPASGGEAPAERPRPDGGARDRPRPDGDARDRPADHEDPEEPAPRRPPYDPASTTAW